MDKWLWAARFFKTRAMAAKACDLGRIRSHGTEAKPARDVKVGDMLQIKTEGGDYEVEVLGLSEMRGPAAVAHALYRETDAGKVAREKAAAERKAMQKRATARALAEHLWGDRVEKILQWHRILMEGGMPPEDAP